jgi:hypothetical protein
MVDTAVNPTDIDVTQLTPLSPEVISKQATINIGNSTKPKRHLYMELTVRLAV